MPEIWIIILIHQLLFQGMFIAKNIILHKKTGLPIRGGNREASSSILFFALFIGLAFGLSLLQTPFGSLQLLAGDALLAIAAVPLLLSLIVSAASLIGLKDSWRVGILEAQRTELVTAGIYRFTRNPYFVACLLMFSAYTVLLQSLILLALAIAAYFFIHKMVLREEAWLLSMHGDAYRAYQKRTPRYLII